MMLLYQRFLVGERYLGQQVAWRHKISSRFLSYENPKISSIPFQEQEMKVLVLRNDGSQKELCLSPKDLKNKYNIYYRDITSLGVSLGGSPQLKLKYNRRSSTLLSPRESCVVVSIGNIKAILLSSSVIIFDHDTPVVKSWLNQYSFQRYNPQETFELFILEDLLINVCNNFDRRLLLYHALLRNLEAEKTAVQSTTTEATARAKQYPTIPMLFRDFKSLFESESLQDPDEDIIYKLSPLIELLNSFEIEIRECRERLHELLKNDEELAQVLLTERQRAAENGVHFDTTKHESIELLLENYALHMSQVINDVIHLENKVQNQKDVSDLTMKIKRNRLLWLNANLAATSVCLGFGACVFGLFGMNLTSGLEAIHPSVFYGVGSGTLLLCVYAYSRLKSAMHNVSPFSSQQLNRHSSIINHYYVKSLLLDSVFIDSLLTLTERRLQLKGVNGRMTRSEFMEIYREIKGGGGRVETSVDPNEAKEVNIIFDMIDVNSDGHWNTKEILSSEEIEQSRERQGRYHP
jgi:hypothetical protein